MLNLHSEALSFSLKEGLPFLICSPNKSNSKAFLHGAKPKGGGGGWGGAIPKNKGALDKSHS
jgi:hypothetical protein